MPEETPKARRMSPQEKKALSYARDGRNAYGENDKSSRKNIPRRKRLVNRSNRHAERQLLSGAEGARDDEVADAAESCARGRRPKIWKKDPDVRLGNYLAERKRRREAK